jgi:hypothetical protein
MSPKLLEFTGDQSEGKTGGNACKNHGQTEVNIVEVVSNVTQNGDPSLAKLVYSLCK